MRVTAARHWRHIHSQIVYPLLVALILVGAVATVVAIFLIGGIVDRWVASTARLALNDAVVRIDTAARDTERLAALAAKDVRLAAALERGDAAGLIAGLVEVESALRADNLMLLDVDGRVVASTGRLQLAPGDTPFGGRLPHLAPSATGRAAFMTIRDTLTLTALRPIETRGQRGYVLAVSTAVDEAFMRQLARGSTVGFCLMEPDTGRMAAAAPEGASEAELVAACRDRAGALTHPAPEEAALFEVRIGGTSERYRLAARAVTYASGSLESRAVLVVAVPTKIADDALRTTTVLIAWWSLVAVVLLIGLDVYVARSVSRPLENIAEAVSRVERGDFQAKAEVSGSNELAVLAKSINDMTDSLRERSEHLTRKVLELATLYEMSRTLGSTLDEGSLLDSVLDSALRIFDVEIGYVTLIDEETGELTVRAWRGIDHASLAGEPRRSSLADWVVKEGRPLIFNPPADGTTPGEPGIDGLSGALATLTVPLTSGGGTIGAVTIGSRRSSVRFTSDDVRLLATIANHVTIALGNIALFTNLQEA